MVIWFWLMVYTWLLLAQAPISPPSSSRSTFTPEPKQKMRVLNILRFIWSEIGWLLVQNYTVVICTVGTGTQLHIKIEF